MRYFFGSCIREYIFFLGYSSGNRQWACQVPLSSVSSLGQGRSSFMSFMDDPLTINLLVSSPYAQLRFRTNISTGNISWPTNKLQPI